MDNQIRKQGSQKETGMDTFTRDGDEYPNKISPVNAKVELPRGLHNQGATCYLNCLMQALYMTPEFRNGIYRCHWSCRHTIFRLSYQLQRLFLTLQMGTGVVYTYGLTRCLENTSCFFGCNNANGQKDIQEFWHEIADMLEVDLEGTGQHNLIKDMYTGEMEDYVQCTGCGSKDSKQVAFLDVPLVVKASSSKEMSVVDALFSFIVPTLLEDSDQSYCDKCQKKCNALKGLKFTKFPPILTLQLMRFETDPRTKKKRKLNCRVEFPHRLYLSPYLHWEHPNNVEKEMPYDLFAVLLHAGDCNSGHYYAYIKSLQEDQWYCFDDRRVFQIPSDKIERAYGGNGHQQRSGNAYTLFYRIVDDERENGFMDEALFPPHLVELLGVVTNPWPPPVPRNEFPDSSVQVTTETPGPLGHNLQVELFGDEVKVKKELLLGKWATANEEGRKELKREIEKDAMERWRRREVMRSQYSEHSNTDRVGMGVAGRHHSHDGHSEDHRQTTLEIGEEAEESRNGHHIMERIQQIITGAKSGITTTAQ